MEWTLEELTAEAAAALAAEQTAQADGRVRDMPNERTIRWYVTIGLLDPPLRRRGRLAVYGRRHLLQLVAIKRRQAEGRTIAEIQLELAMATDARLGEIARLSHDGAEPEQPRRFWAERPAALPDIVHGVRLAAGVTLIVDASALSTTDAAAIRAAAGPLLDLLTERGLTCTSDR